MSCHDHLQQNILPIMALSKSYRSWQSLIPRFIEHDALKPIMQWITFEMNRPEQREARGRAVYGVPGAGKSMLSSAIQRRYTPSVGQSTIDQMPRVTAITMTGAREAKVIYERVLDSLGVPDFDEYRSAKRERMVIKACRESRLRLIIVDEVQDVLNSTPRQQRISLDTIKYLMNELGVSILVLGTKKSPAAMRVDEHLNARFEFDELGLWRNGEGLRRFLSAYERSLPLALPSNINSPELSALLSELSNGNLRKLCQIVAFAASHAIESGVERISQEMIELAVSRPPSAFQDVSRGRAAEGDLFHAA